MLTRDLLNLKVVNFKCAVDTLKEKNHHEPFRVLATKVGTAIYQAPELRDIMRRNFTVRTDFFACGIIIQLAVTGMEPIERIRDSTMCRVPERTGSIFSFTYLIWQLMVKCNHEKEAKRPAEVTDIRRAVHLNILYAAAYSSNVLRVAIESVRINDDFDVNMINHERGNHSCLLLASMCESFELMEALLSKKPRTAIINHRDKTGCTAVRIACRDGLLDIARALKRVGADLTMTSNCGLSCLMMASYNGHLSVVEWLLTFEEVCNTINQKEDDGDTALSLASKRKQKQIVSVLRANGGREASFWSLS